ncbi:hypothetical protein [Methylobacterium aerolatum]|uniref:Uncharacterized protein n=1 Tax=Methylobacterium aerolatum TaxID=418708 RepID=A0ABU0HTM2_9HYPH|nr:hypothetical protein [Methylobacterium aerolatum]MDQ0445670.1 hypothetical protein [Methylobacterium aerolatum]GJD36220.1 hypothetical protein FMGBMHLM_3135 [Methylobacterium aerolatum]
MMISVEQFCNHAVSAGEVSAEDLRALKRDVIPDGIATREEADLLIALERAVPACEDFADFLVAMVVDYVVWGERSTGYVDRDAAAWLSASISGRDGPSPVGARIAQEIVREAQGSAEALTAFALEANRWVREPAARTRRTFALAA